MIHSGYFSSGTVSTDDELAVVLAHAIARVIAKTSSELDSVTTLGGIMTLLPILQFHTLANIMGKVKVSCGRLVGLVRLAQETRKRPTTSDWC